ASLERIFKLHVLRPTYGIALLTALSFMLVATMPLVSHLGKPFRAYEIMVTPHLSSAMAIFGFVYLWYLMVVLLLEIWFDYRRDMVIWAGETTGFKRFLYRAFSLWSTDISPKAVILDNKLGYIVTIIGVPSAFLLHGYVGFIFGSIKANPWWSTVLMPVIFLFSAIVSGIALVMLVYIVITRIRKQKIDMPCLDTIASYLFYILLIDFVLEGLDQIHRIYIAEESFDVLHNLVFGRLFFTLFIMQGLIGTVIPLLTLGTLQFYTPKIQIRKAIYTVVAALILIGIFFMRWNVVIGGQLFSKSFYGYTSFKIGLIGTEGYLMAAFWLIVPFIILSFLLWLFPPWKKKEDDHEIQVG
ncbi:MAG: NrfD/PsrC family molybdoenzyme membrane anchor subunit, partial [Bacteroidales bacterium]